MKRIILVLFLILWGVPAIVSGIEVAPRITDKEIIERLTRLEEGQKNILREMDKRFEAMDKRFEAMDKRFDQLNNLIIGIFFVFWDCYCHTNLIAYRDSLVKETFQLQVYCVCRVYRVY